MSQTLPAHLIGASLTLKIAEHHLVVGAGIAGCVSAILRRAVGYEVTVVDKRVSRSPAVYPVCTETSSIVSENHSGAEYPFDAASGMDCLDGRIANQRFFPDVIYGGKSHTRIIASERMSQGPEDIRRQCRLSLARLRDHYRRRVAEEPANEVLGHPDDFVTEFPGGPQGVRDASATFVTPQRGINPTYTAAVLDAELRSLGVRFIAGATVQQIKPQANGEFHISWLTELDGQHHQVFDQVCVAASVNGFGLALALNPGLALPQIYLALRQILLVRLPDGAHTPRDFTCLKLEHAHGGMFSPFNPRDILVYYPPLAHMAVTMMPPGGNVPDDYREMVAGHGPTGGRVGQTIDRLSEYYPELADATVTGIYHKIAINTVDDSRVRRNMGVFAVAPGCSLLILPKWTMAVRNAVQDVTRALGESVRRGHLTAAAAAAKASELARYRVAVPAEWSHSPDNIRASAQHHAANMGLPLSTAESFITSPPQVPGQRLI
jgi:hypothetical protein